MENNRNYTMEQTPGALGLGQSTATRVFCGFFVLYFTCPIFFAPIIDSRLGQYKTLVASLAIYTLGCTALVASSAPKLLDRGSGLPGLAVAMFLIALGGGCSQATIRSFIAAQYTDRTPRLQKRLPSQSRFCTNTRKRLEHTSFSKWLPPAATEEVVLVDPELTLKFIYTLLFWVGNVGALLVFPIVCIERFHGFFPAYLLGLGCVSMALLMIIAGRKSFVKPPLSQNVTLPAAKVLLCAARSGFNMEHADPHYRSVHGKKAVAWSSQFVVEITRALGACRVLLAFVVFYICFDQMQNNLISQAGHMNKGKTPNEVVPSMNQVACIIVSPLVEYVVDPALSKRRIYLRPVTRIAIGFIFISLSMAYAAVVQHFIYMSPPCFSHPSHCENNPGASQHRPNIWIQTPVFVLMAAGEVFAMTTAMEYAERHAPHDMKVFVQAINMLITGVGSVCAMLIAEAAHDPYLVIFYSCLAGGMAATTVIFYILFRNKDRDATQSPHDPENAITCDNNKDKEKTTPCTGNTTQESLGLDAGVGTRAVSSERD
ncbi:peptide transporter ptr2 [Exserohilum turcicum]